MIEQTTNASTTTDPYYRVPAADTSIGVLQCLFGFTSTTLNVLVIIGFIRLGLKGKVANILYCTLSVSDTLTGISSIVYSILLLDDGNLELLTGDESFFNVFKLKEGFRICVWLGPLFAFSMMMTISLINVITFCRTFAVAAPFYYKLYLRKSVVLVVVFMLASHALFIGIIPLINDVHVYFLDAHSGICAIIPLPGLDHLLKHLQISLVTIPITIHCVMVVMGTLVLLYFLDKRRKKVVVNEKSGLLSLCYKKVAAKNPFTRNSHRDSISETKSKLQSVAGQSNAAQVDKSTQRAERTVLGLLCSFMVTYSFWLVGFYMQVHATNKVELPAAWFGITPHVSYYMFRSEEKNKDSKEYFLFTAYGPLCLVILVILNSMVNPIIHLVFNRDLRESAIFCIKKKRATPSNSHGSIRERKLPENRGFPAKPMSNTTTNTNNKNTVLANPTVCVEMQNLRRYSSSNIIYTDEEIHSICDVAAMECTEKEFQFLEEEVECGVLERVGASSCDDVDHQLSEKKIVELVDEAKESEVFGEESAGKFDESSTLDDENSVIRSDLDDMEVYENRAVVQQCTAPTDSTVVQQCTAPSTDSTVPRPAMPISAGFVHLVV